MYRTEKEISEGWQFARENQEECYRAVTLPHDWAVELPYDKDMEEGEAQGFHQRFGFGWYRRKLILEHKSEDKCYYLEFGGIYENSTVWINGKEAGGRKYGYSTFRLDITPFIEDGENLILVKVDNTAKPADRWYSGAGIYRTVKWIEVNRKHFNDWEIEIKTKLSGLKAHIFIKTSALGTVRGVLKAPMGKEEWQSMSDSEGNQVFEISNPVLWSAEEPNLYELELILYDGEVKCDCIHKKIGIRSVEFKPKQGMYVNGEHVILKGVCIHQDVGCRGIAAKKEVWRKRLENLKEMGCNALRLAHHTFSEEFMDLCDEMGFYVYEECFDKWTGGLYGRYFETEWKKDMDAMIKRDRNRPSIVIWGVGNEVENQAQASMLHILKQLTAYAKQLDSTRPVTYAMNPHFKREGGIKVSEAGDIQKFVDEVSDTEIYDNRERVECILRIGEIVDIISCNYQEQWYSLIHNAMPEKLILGTEVYQMFLGEENHMQNFTEENPALVPNKYPYCIGSMLWTGIDYLGESMGYPSKGWSGSVIRTNGVRRPMYYVFQSYWSKKPVISFFVMDYSLQDEGTKEHWAAPIYAQHWHFPQIHRALIPYCIATNCDEVKLYLNDKQFQVPAPKQCKNRVITGYLPYQPGTVNVVGYKNGIEVCREEIRTPKPAVRLSFEEELTYIPEIKNYERLLTVRAEDEEGNFYFRESAMVYFKAEGAAEIIAVDNGNLMSGEAYYDKGIHLYQGKASVMVRFMGTKGRVKIRAYAEGMREAEAVVIVENQEGKDL